MSVENPLVSVIIPVYNTEKYLKECLDSVLNQTLKEIEVICIDDKSTDNSLNILEKYAKKDSRIKLIKNEENTGQAIARNIGLNEVKGEYISFIDSDDKIDLDTYEKLYNFSKAKQDVIIFNMVRLDNKGNISESELHLKSIKRTEENTNLLKNKDLVYDTTAGNKFIKTSFLKENNIKFIDKLYEDILFSMELFIATNSVGILKDVNYYWRRRKNTNKSTTQDRTNIKNIKDRIFIIKSIIELFKSDIKYKNVLKELYFRIAELDFIFYINQIDKGDEEYKNIILTEIKPLIKTLPKEIFKEIDNINKVKYDLLLNGNIENLIYIVEKEKEYKIMCRQNTKWKKEITEIKSTKGWFKYKTDNINTRIKAKINNEELD